MKSKNVRVGGLVAIAAVVSMGCATSSPAGSVSDRNRISAAELAATNSPTVYEALELTRPEWMTSRGAVITEERANVYMYGQHVGDLDYLKTVYVIDVAELRYWRAGEAGARFGMGNPRGVIEVIPR